MASGFSSTKLNLRSTSKISLSDRFKLVRQRALINRTLGATKTSIQFPVSKKNRLLAQRMANKPSVLAALKIKRKSIKQRLGKIKPKRTPNITRPFKTNKQSQNQTALQSAGNRFRLNRNNFVGTTRVSTSNRVSKRRNNKPRNMTPSNQTRGNVGNRSALFSQNRSRNKKRNRFSNNRITMGIGFKNNQTRRGGRGLSQKRNNKGRNQRGFNQKRNINSNFYNQNKKTQGQNQKKGNLQWPKRKNVNKSQLDKDLDEYMAKTRSQLDADLDAYMAGA